MGVSARAVAVVASPAHRSWLANLDRRAVAPQAVAAIVRQRLLTRDSFRVLDAMEQVTDPDGKSFFVIPRGTGGKKARLATLLTYILNAGTGYGRTAVRNDFPETPYGAAEVGRIVERQHANRWSYEAVRGICDTGGCLVTTPHGVLMGLGGNRFHAQLSRRAGTMWGDLFLVNADRVSDPARRLRDIVESGRISGDGPGLDRLLHHEEIHARQWAALGPLQMPARYLAEEARARIFGGTNSFERDAGLSDGGYR
ncbi:hypothetical protein MTER_27150 [Mycolicibacter terrae]|uniref:Uncharacterized protein n=1 Tax=Mycolicibacter terrae TaxID=1788 RepID=A0AAD1HXS2_9MYCO|nr:hypothetical protein [Mycolicibacter terrae]BBX23304.1 hypothetical protein MTER_27150 [Mycolicibacter terrae]